MKYRYRTAILSLVVQAVQQLQNTNKWPAPVFDIMVFELMSITKGDSNNFKSRSNTTVSEIFIHM